MRNLPHLMLKEIQEEPKIVQEQIKKRVLKSKNNILFPEAKSFIKRLKEINHFIFVGCGTSYHAGLLGKYFFQENLKEIYAEAEIASEFDYLNKKIGKRTAILFLSQSGETVDVLSLFFKIQKSKALKIAVTNVEDSSLAKNASLCFFTECGSEKALAATKTFLGQLAIIFLLSLFLKQEKKVHLENLDNLISEFLRLPTLMKKVLSLNSSIKRIAQKYKNYKNFFLIGRRYHFPIALEGALKIKETSYIHSEGIPGGELRHGPMAVIDENIGIIFFIPSDSLYEKNLSLLKEIKAKNAKIIALATEGNKDIEKITKDVVFLPKTIEMLYPFLSAVFLQLFAYYLSISKGLNVDKPRYLSKAVLVE